MVAKDEVKDYLFRGELSEIDPDVAELIRHETARQARYLIMIPSESSVPQAVREALGSSFHNIYAEGYPLESNRTLTQAEILDYNKRLPEYRRLADERYYMGTEYANISESLARRRVAEVYAANGYTADQLYVNVQALSGAPANNAVYTALLSVGDTVMGLDLIEGGHLTHGSPVNRSGKNFNIVSYGVDPETERIDYERMRELAIEHKPKMIIGGYSSYPWQADWAKYREIADEVGAYLLADVAHVAGLIAAGVYPNPVGIADVVTFTSHKTLAGPRGAVIITHRKDLSSKLDRAVFPGEQGGPHVNQFTALAVAMKLAATEQFRELQQQTVENALRLSEKLQERGVRVPFGGTNTHLLNIDCKVNVGADGTALSGDMAARILDLAGIVANRQTIPGDTSALRPSGVRFGTPWITQRGFGIAEIDTLANIIADLVLGAVPYKLATSKRDLERAKIDFELLQSARLHVRDLAESVGIDTDAIADDYPHFHYLEEPAASSHNQHYLIQGEKTGEFLNYALTSDIFALKMGDSQPTAVLGADGEELSRGTVERLKDGYLLHLGQHAAQVATWLRALSDGIVMIEASDPYGKLPGPVDVVHDGPTRLAGDEAGYAEHKAWFIGANGEAYAGPKGDALPKFEWTEVESDDLKTTTLYDLHKQLGAKTVPFAGYDMPVWYSSVTEEHLAVRKGAGIFDVTHMGVFDVKGSGAANFLNTVTTNDVFGLAVGESHYTYFLDVDGIPLDDLMIYRLAEEHFLVVVNASNNDKNWTWLNAVKNREVMIDPERPYATIEGADRFELRDLRDPAYGTECRVDVALQGPTSRDILLSLGGSDADVAKVKKLTWAGVAQVTIGGFDLIVSRTGYTGERMAFELFVHPDQAPSLFEKLVNGGAVPCGLAARDSLRTEAGLPLYGHELEGPLTLSPAGAGFGSYVKVWKPFFIGRKAYIEAEMKRDAKVIRFRLDNKVARPPHQGDPLVDSKGRVVGIVTSCSIDSEGYQLGQAYVKLDDAKLNNQLGVFAGSSRAKPESPKDAGMGKKLPVPETVTILTRFPKKK